MLYFQAVFVTVSLIFLVIIFLASGEKKPKLENQIGKEQIWVGLRKKGIKLLGFFLLFLRTVLGYRFLKVCYSQLICWKGSPYLKASFAGACYSGGHLYLTIGLVVALVLVIFLIILSQLFVFRSDPFSKVPFASFLNRLWIYTIY